MKIFEVEKYEKSIDEYNLIKELYLQKKIYSGLGFLIFLNSKLYLPKCKVYQFEES